MTQVLAAASGVFRDRDLFIHDGSKLRRFRISAPLQAVFFVITVALVAWASYATARLMTQTRPAAAVTPVREKGVDARRALLGRPAPGQIATTGSVLFD